MEKKKKKANVGDDILAELDQFDQQSEAPDDGEPIRIRVSDDRLKAFANVTPPMDSDQSMTKEDVIKALEEYGVVHGIDDEGLEEIFTYGSYNVDVAVAKGTPPKDGQDASIELKFETSGAGKPKAKEDEHGNVDHRELNLIDSVEAGDVLAVKQPPVPGEPGKNVLGDELPAEPGKDIDMPLGENVEVGNDGVSILASKDGQPIFKGGKVGVSPVYEVKSDVNYATGNINFNGSVMIKGNVQSDFIVSATDDVTIDGNIEKAKIEAGGDVHINGGIYGATEGLITAGGSIIIRTVESAILEAGADIVIEQSSRYSTLMAGENIILKNSKGSIVGGKATAGATFEVTNLGSQSFTETVVEVGINPKVKEAYDTIDKNITDHKVQLEKVMRTIKTIKEMQQKTGSIAPDKQEMLKKCIPAAHKLKAALETDQKKKGFLEEKMKSLHAGRCKVSGTLYPGVKIFTLGASMNVQKELKHSSLYEQNEQIVVGPY